MLLVNKSIEKIEKLKGLKIPKKNTQGYFYLEWINNEQLRL